MQVPTPPEGLRPGQLGVVLLRRVIIGDIAATLVDLANRKLLTVAEEPDGASTDSPPPGRNSPPGSAPSSASCGG